jgi:hypothetical protein
MKSFTLTSFLFVLIFSIAYLVVGERAAVSLDSKNPYSRKPASIQIKSAADVRVKNLNLFETYIERISALENCIDYRCDDDQSKATKAELTNLYQYVLKQEKKDKRILKIADKYLGSSNIQLKELSLLLISTQSPSVNTLKSILKNVKGESSPNIMALTLMELEKYKGKKYRTQLSLHRNTVESIRRLAVKSRL